MARYPENRDAHQESERYTDNSVRAKENRSSAGALLIVGGVGFVGVALGIAGVIPLRLANPYLFYGVMMAVFLLFVVIGVFSLKNARIFAEKAKVEDTLLETVEKWCLETLKPEDMPREFAGESSQDDVRETGGETLQDNVREAAETDGNEALYFRRAEYLKEQINRQFLNLDQGLLERFIDERLYERIFGE